MAESDKIVALNIGSQKLTMGVLAQSSSGKLILKKYDSSEILADPAAEMARMSQVRVAIAELASKLGVSKSTVDYVVSGQSVFIRFVKLPAIQSQDIEQLVAFEAQQHVPFPLDDVVWDWQMVGQQDGQNEIVLVAIKSDALDDINLSVNSSNLTTGYVDVSPLAIANAFAYNYSDLDESAVLVDIGARTTNLVFKDGDKLFTRSVATGGSTVTTAIGKEYHIPFSDAEAQKVTNGMVALDTHHTSDMDELTGALATCIRTALSKLPAEVSRTTSFFRSQHGGSAPKRVFLAGGGANMPLIAEFFQQKLRLPVEYFNPLAKVSVAGGVDVDRVTSEAHTLGDLIGVALRRAEKAKLNVDLVPDTVQEERKEARRRPRLISAAVIIVAAAAVSWFMNNQRLSAAEEALKQEKGKVSELQSYLSPIKQDLERANLTTKTLISYAQARNAETVWLDLLSDTKKHFSAETLWLVDFDPVAVTAFPATESTIYSVLKGENKDEAYDSEITAKLVDLKGEQVQVNAIRLSGLCRTEGAREVRAQLEKLIQESEHFDFDLTLTGKNSDQSVTTSVDGLILNLKTMIAEGDIASPFSILVPLKHPITIQKKNSI